MKEFKFSALCLIAALFASIHTASGQVINASAQNVSSRPVPRRAAPAARPIANSAVAPHIAPRPASVVPRTVNSYAPPTVAAINAQRNRRSAGQEPITLDAATRQNELRTLAAMRERRAIGTGNRTLAAINAQQPAMTHAPAARPQLETPESPGNLARTKWHNSTDRPSASDAFRRHRH